jgi:OPT family oligopeptide transporter
MDEPLVQTRLPENAYRELKPGETYEPMVPASVRAPEITLRSVLFGIAMNVVFSLAATFVALKVGQGIETAIPISVLAVGLSALLMRMGHARSSLLENVNILAISTTSGIVAGGTVFTMPAIYLLKLPDALHLSTGMLFFTMFLVPLLGAALGVLFLVPFRRYFVKEMHGKLPFPEGTATNEILVTGAGDTGSAWVLVYSCIVGGITALLSGGLRLWNEIFTTGDIKMEIKDRVLDVATGKAVFPAHEVDALAFAGKYGHLLTEKLKLVFSLGTGAEFVGLGYIIGVRYASIICAGSILSSIVIVPLLAPLTIEALQSLNPSIKGVSADAIFSTIPKNIGIGCIFTAGILSILKMSKVIVTALKEALGGLFKSSGTVAAHDRTDEDISYPTLMIIGTFVTIVLAWFFYSFVMKSMPDPIRLTVIAVLLALVVAFVFTTVSAWAIATISVTPISGMTVTTIIVTAVVLLACGLSKGPTGQFAVLMVGGVVASALSMAGTLVTEFKIGYWMGASPKRIQWSALISAALASALVTGTIMLLAKSPGYDPASASSLQAPQANLMRSALDSFMGTGQVPWLLYGVGVAIALMLELVKVSPLAFGLGMYLPMNLNAPLLVGALVAAWVPRKSRDEATAKARNDKGILIASGLIAGAAIMGVIVRGLSAAAEGFMLSIDLPANWIKAGKSVESVLRQGNWLGLVTFLGICLFVYVDARRAKPSGEFRDIPKLGH